MVTQATKARRPHPHLPGRRPARRVTLVPRASQAVDFLKPASSIVPKGSLCIRHDDGSGLTTIRSLLWPGAVAYTLGGSWGYCYFGTGEKNADIAFMLP